MSQEGREQADGQAPKGLTGLLATACFVIGSAGLLIAMTTDTLAVAGRHLRVPLLGSIEIVQACVVVAASAAMVGATLTHGHASVHILLERLSPKRREVLLRISDVLGAVLAIGLLIGSAWIAADLWDGHERTEQLGLPLIPLRLFWCASAGLMALLFLRSALSRRRRDVSHGA